MLAWVVALAGCSLDGAGLALVVEVGLAVVDEIALSGLLICVLFEIEIKVCEIKTIDRELVRAEMVFN